VGTEKQNPVRTGRSRELPLARCLACDGYWFREADFYRFRREEYLGRFWDTWPELTGRLSTAPMTLLVCLCGSPLRPNLGGVRGGHTPNFEVGRLFSGLKAAHRAIRQRHDAFINPGRQGTPTGLEVLDRRLANLLRDLGRRHGIRRGRYWEPPSRKAQSGVLTREGLALKLQQIDFTFDQARKIVTAVFEAIKEGLRGGGTVPVPPRELSFGKTGPSRKRACACTNSRRFTRSHAKWISSRRKH
jgi:hypothetical protein